MPDDPTPKKRGALAALFALAGLTPKDEPRKDDQEPHRPMLDRTPVRWSPGLLDATFGTPIGIGVGETTAPIRDAVWGLPLGASLEPTPKRSPGFRQDVRLPVEQSGVKR